MDLYGLSKYKHQIAVLDSLRRRILLFLPVAALAELVSVCFVRIPEISPLQRMSKTTGRDGPREKNGRGVWFSSSRPHGGRRAENLACQ